MTPRTYHTSFKRLHDRPDEDVDGDAVRGYSILTTDVVVFEALENDRGHSTLCAVEVDGERVQLARTATRPLPDWIAALEPGSEYRIAAATAWHAASDESARDMILEAYPEARAAVEHGIARWDGGNLLTDVETAERIVSGEPITGGRS